MNNSSLLPSLHRGRVFILFMISLIISPLTALTDTKDMVTVVVQFEMDMSIIRSEDAYSNAMKKAMEEAMADGPADLVIFPEYLGVFAALIPWYSYLSQDRSFEETWMAVREDHPELDSINELLLKESSGCDAFLDELWGSLADEYDVYILSGTRFIYNRTRGGLVNQAVVYNPKGREAYKQNKHFLTEFEEEILGLKPGNIMNAEGFYIKNQFVRLTICRDTFLKEWESLYSSGDLWIDIKANGESYTDEQMKLFTRALPARLGKTDIPYGITACLTGDFLDLFWEGSSSFIYNNNGRVSYLEVSDSADSFEIMRKRIPGN